MTAKTTKKTKKFSFGLASLGFILILKRLYTAAPRRKRIFGFAKINFPSFPGILEFGPDGPPPFTLPHRKVGPLWKILGTPLPIVKDLCVTTALCASALHFLSYYFRNFALK